MRMFLGAVTAAALALTAGIALAQAMEEVTGKIENIDATTKMVTVGDTALQWSENATGAKLDELKEGDEVKVKFKTNTDGHNDIMEIMKE
jgi:Cu/Ag efflux protein CusF